MSHAEQSPSKENVCAMHSTDDADTLEVCAHKRARPQEADDDNINPDRFDRWAIICVC